MTTLIKPFNLINVTSLDFLNITKKFQSDLEKLQLINIFNVTGLNVTNPLDIFNVTQKMQDDLEKMQQVGIEIQNRGDELSLSELELFFSSSSIQARASKFSR